MRSLLRLQDGSYVYVAQIGDGRDYASVCEWHACKSAHSDATALHGCKFHAACLNPCCDTLHNPSLADLHAVVENAGFDPATSGQVWTSPAQDPYLNGKLARKVSATGLWGGGLCLCLGASLVGSSMRGPFAAKPE